MINAFLLVGDIFMPEMHLRQPGFTYSAHVFFTKNGKTNEKSFEKLKIQNIFIKTSQIIIAFCMTWLMENFQNLTERIIADKILHDKTSIYVKCKKSKI